MNNLIHSPVIYPRHHNTTDIFPYQKNILLNGGHFLHYRTEIPGTCRQYFKSFDRDTPVRFSFSPYFSPWPCRTQDQQESFSGVPNSPPHNRKTGRRNATNFEVVISSKIFLCWNFFSFLSPLCLSSEANKPCLKCSSIVLSCHYFVVFLLFPRCCLFFLVERLVLLKWLHCLYT